MIFLYASVALLGAIAFLFSLLAAKVAEAKRVSKKPNCYYCGSPAFHVSSPNGLPDRLLANWNCIPHRCEICFRRQYRLARAAGSDDR